MKGYIPLLALMLSGCGEFHRESAVTYSDYAVGALIEYGACASKEQCISRSRIFWEGAAPARDKVHINLYQAKDKNEILVVQKALFKARQELAVGVIFRAYSSSHDEPEELVFKGVLE